uniref:Plexin b1a n=1 Tax=Hucho hucho TaxID=62062 RepID=A0A4W5N036_9TELE
MSLILALLVFLLVTNTCSLAVRTYPRFSRNDTSFEHLVLHPDPSVGTVYVGARDHLFQLDGLDGLRLEQEERTGPVTDSKECLPPVTEANCPQARHTSNHNKLLLVDPSAMELITCGNVHQGTCQKRSLTSLKEVLFSTERPVDTQYVAANDPGVSTVGLVVGPRGGDRAVLYVGRGYTSSHPPISTRHLAHEPVFSYDETAKLAVAGRLSEYDHHFVAAFARRGHVYFLFYRRDIKAVSREYRTYAARVCLDDTSYYSYVEVPLVCHSSSTSSPKRNYNLLQAAQVGQGGGREGEKLLGVFSTRASSSNGPSDDSALCVYPLDELDRHIDSTRDLCYTQDGRVEGGGEVAYIEYEVKSSCANLPTNTLKAYPCGSDHTPSPMASRVPIEAEAVLDSPSARLTAVAVSVRAGHTIAFLGDSKGNLHKVCQVTVGYDACLRMWVTFQVAKRPVAECGDHLDCQSCLSAREPYCGWCVLEGGETPFRLIVLTTFMVGYKGERLMQICAVVGSLTPGILFVPVTLFNCSVGRSDCSRCRTADQKYGCVWCGGAGSRCSYRDSCAGEIKQSCPAPVIHFMEPISGPVDGGTVVTISGSNLGQKAEDIQNSVTIAGVPCTVINSRYEISSRIVCETTASGGQKSGQASVEVRGGGLGFSGQRFSFQDPVLIEIAPQKGPKVGGSALTIMGQSLKTGHLSEVSVLIGGLSQVGGTLSLTTHCVRNISLFVLKVFSLCVSSGGRLIRVSGQNLDVVQEPRIRVTISPLESLSPRKNRKTRRSSRDGESRVRCREIPLKRQRRIVPEPDCPEDMLCVVKQVNWKCVIVLNQGENLDLAIFKEEVVALIGDGVCSVKTLTHNHLYCEPPSQQPSVMASKKQEGMDSLPEFTVQMGNLNFSLGRVQYDTQVQSTFPLELFCLSIYLSVRRKSKQAVRDYKKVQIQLENLETSVRDRCKKEFTDLMTEMMDCSSDLVGSGIPFLDYRAYAERIFFPGHRESPLRRDLDVPECRRQTVEQGLVQLSNLLNSKLFLTTFIHTLEVQRTFSPRDRAYVASLLTVALHGKLEYFTDILKTLLNDLVVQYMAKNPRLMLRRTESVVEKLLTNWMSMCLFTFLRDTAGESFYMLFRAIKHQVDKGPVDVVTGKAKYTLNDNRLLREDVDYKTLTAPAKVLDCDTITQVKEKLLEQAWKGMSFSQRPHTDSLHLEWRAGTAGHLILSDEDLTSVVQGSWKRLNTLLHYKVPDGATVALVPRNTKHVHNDSHDYIPGEKTPMLDDGDEGGVKLWHLVKANEEPDLPKHRRGSLRERERAKAIPEIYLTRLLSMKGTLQKFVDDLFTVILSTNQPVPMAVKYFFDLLDEQALQHNITDSETIHIWKTNSLPLRFWINILKNPQFIFDVQASDHVDAVLSVIAQTFMDSCTIAEHKLGRVRQTWRGYLAKEVKGLGEWMVYDQEMNSALAELSRNYAGEVNYLVALHELYKYINKYYDQIITALEEDSTAQKMQLGYRLQQISAAVENKVTDL